MTRERPRGGWTEERGTSDEGSRRIPADANSERSEQ
ncbi:MAG: hypothetical protein JWN52_3339 [Actinomycetia bacterium]|jgi:hypothetical protein|nr:hypothetical protein [Actinomycetes bacterium]